METPTISSGFIPASHKAFNIPICAAPLTAPPEKTKTVFGFLFGTQRGRLGNFIDQYQGSLLDGENAITCFCIGQKKQL